MSEILELLSAELISCILEEAAPRDLNNLISASPYCYRVFATRPERFRIASLKSVVPKPLWREFAAACFASRNFYPLAKPKVNESDYDNDKRIAVAGRLISADKTQVTCFLVRYFSNSPNLEFSLATKDDVLAAHRLYRKTSYFINEFTRKASREARSLARYFEAPNEVYDTPPHEISKESEAAIDLSDSETIRFYRAFFRFQIYCKLFRPPQNRTQFRIYSGQDQFQLFLGRFEPWEVEEMTCIHQYLSDIVLEALKEMDSEFEAYVRQIAATVSPEAHDNKHCPKGSDSCPTRRRKFVNFSRMELAELYGIDSALRWNRSAIMSSIVSNGLCYMFEFFRSPRDARFEQLRGKHDAGAFMLNAIPRKRSYLAHPITHYANANMYDERFTDPMRTTLGSALYGADRLRGYLNITETKRWIPFRVVAYCFWDAERLLSKMFTNALFRAAMLNLRDVIALYMWDADACPEKNLQGFRLPSRYEATLLEKFGILDQD